MRNNNKKKNKQKKKKKKKKKWIFIPYYFTKVRWAHGALQALQTNSKT